ncbi:phosphomethylpyrimidine synthase ThiC [Candidatus Nitrosocosmicus arcticus]|uniref:phosphomethylpyrimidine synthase ThiC n=1 Tax=Candidatus Nitrosocosmicus arcticus TaxID=2035267 RepID=UPI0028F43CE3|nr:phosphomethylpyrimidine synthase ThiC [Candidatus Nitrosocosmicus arcticus]
MKVIGIGKGLKTKVNVNIGTSILYQNIEVSKAKSSLKYSADTMMTLSDGLDLNIKRRNYLVRHQLLHLVLCLSTKLMDMELKNTRILLT